MTFRTETTQAGLSLALGVQEVRPIDLVSAYGTLANGGRYIPHTTILTVKDAGGDGRRRAVRAARGRRRSASPAVGVHRDRHPGRQHEPEREPVLGRVRDHERDGDRRPATLKTGTNNDAKDLNAYGFIAPPTADGRAAGEYALAVGAWNGNSDNSRSSSRATGLLDRRDDLRLAGLPGRSVEELGDQRLRRARRPRPGEDRSVDRACSRPPGGQSVDEWFIAGTEPTSGPAGRALRLGRPRPRRASRRTSRTGCGPTATGWLGLVVARAPPAASTGRGRVYFYDGRFTPYGKSWGPFVEGRGCSAADAGADRASRCRRRTRAASSPRSSFRRRIHRRRTR